MVLFRLNLEWPKIEVPGICCFLLVHNHLHTGLKHWTNHNHSWASSDIDTPPPQSHHGEIVELGIVDVSIDIVAVEPSVVHHPLDQEGSVAPTSVGPGKRALLKKW